MRRTDRIVTLYRDRELQLWGIPYAMRQSIGQEPRHLQEANPNPGSVPEGWVWLGVPGWWGKMSKAEIAEVRAFLATCEPPPPENPLEWVEVAGRACGARGNGEACLRYKNHDGDHASGPYRWSATATAAKQKKES